MTIIFKALMAATEDYIGTIETASLKRHEEGKSYTNDKIEINGVMESGRKFCLEFTMED